MRCKHFKIWELVPKVLFESYEEHKLWYLLDDRILLTADLLREQYGKILINNWKTGGDFQERGFRVNHAVTTASLSQHFYGRAIDCSFLDIPLFVVIEDCKAKRYDCFKYITAIEIGITWFHGDCRNSDSDKLMAFKR